MAIYRAEWLGNVIKDICQSLKIGLFSLLLPKLNILDNSTPPAKKTEPSNLVLRAQEKSEVQRLAVGLEKSEVQISNFKFQISNFKF